MSGNELIIFQYHEKNIYKFFSITTNKIFCDTIQLFYFILYGFIMQLSWFNNSFSIVDSVMMSD